MDSESTQRYVHLTKGTTPLDVLSAVLSRTLVHDELCTRLRRRFHATATAAEAAASIRSIDAWATTTTSGSEPTRAERYRRCVEILLVPWPLAPPSPYADWRRINVRVGDSLCTQRVLRYDTRRYDFAGPLRTLFEVPSGTPFEELHATPESVRARLHGHGRIVSGRNAYNRRWKRSENPGPTNDARNAFLEIYRRSVFIYFCNLL